MTTLDLLFSRTKQLVARIDAFPETVSQGAIVFRLGVSTERVSCPTPFGAALG